MKRFYLKIILLLLPLLIYSLVIMLVDPFNYFGISNIYSYSEKRNVSYRYNPVLFNLLEFRKNPKPNITISDSRFAQKNLLMLQNQTGKDFSEIFIFDGMIKELISSFWYVNSIIKPENVYIAINFNNFYVSQRSDLVKSAVTVINDPLLYLLNLNTIEAAYSCLKLKKEYINDTTALLSKHNKENFWSEILRKTQNRFYKNHYFPSEYFKDLYEIKDYCNKNRINLFFVLPPTHSDMQNLIDSNGLTYKKKMLVEELSNITKTYNMDFRNKITNDINLYYDPNHLDKDTLTYLFSKIINNDTTVVRDFVR